MWSWHSHTTLLFWTIVWIPLSPLVVQQLLWKLSWITFLHGLEWFDHGSVGFLYLNFNSSLLQFATLILKPDICFCLSCGIASMPGQSIPCTGMVQFLPCIRFFLEKSSLSTPTHKWSIPPPPPNGRMLPSPTASWSDKLGRWISVKKGQEENPHIQTSSHPLGYP